MFLPYLLLPILIASQYVTPIYSEADLQKLKGCLSCQCVLMANITITSTWAPIGDAAEPFTGTLNGNGKMITFASIGMTGDGNSGLFGAMANATVFDLTLISASTALDLTESVTLSFGLLAGTATNVTVYGCSVTLGGKIGINSGTLTVGSMVGIARNSSADSCFVNTTLTIPTISSVTLGGLFGYAARTQIAKCEVYATSTITVATKVFSGSLVGVLDGSNVTNSVVQGSHDSQAQTDAEYIGGIAGFVNVGEHINSITTSVVNATMQSTKSTNTMLAGVIGRSNSPLEVRNCDVVLSAKGNNGGASAAGIVVISNGILVIDSCNVMTSINANITTKRNVRWQFGGIVGLSTVKGSVINKSTASVRISASARVLNIGGIIASGQQINISNSGALGAITGSVTGTSVASIGGAFGNIMDGTVDQCYFIGSVIVTVGPTVGVAALVGFLTRVTTRSSYAVANMTLNGTTIMSGGFGNLNNATIDSCYVTLNVSATTSNFLGFGGMAGLLGRNSFIKDSFVASSMTTSSLGSVSSGGFVGFVDLKTDPASITGCYAWGQIEVSSKIPGNVGIGGFIATISGELHVSKSLAYVTISTTTKGVSPGLFASLASRPRNAKIGTVENVIVYVTPKEPLTKVRFIETNSTITVLKSYCANYPGTMRCTELSTLNTADFLNTLSVPSFQVSESISNGSISLNTLPAPATGSPVSMPQLVMPSAASAGAWPPESWAVNEQLFLGLPFLKTLNYSRGCGWATGCHGVGSSPIDVTCSPGWTSPAQNTTALVDSLNRCNTFACTSDADCRSGGTCSSGVCKCASGYTGADCSVQVCPVADGKVCGGRACIPFTSVATKGICQCATMEVLTQQGACVPGCTAGGYGVCQAVDTFLCFDGYNTATKCLEYDCSAAKTNICNGKGTCADKVCTCTSGSLLGGNCHAVCTPDITKDCVTFKCGADNSCSSHGQCVPTPTGTESTCLCNVDDAGNPTGTRYVDEFCDACETGTQMIEGKCFTDNCQVCQRGSCTPDTTSETIVCTCPEGRTLKDGKCVTALCGECLKGDCATIQNSGDPTQNYCMCKDNIADPSCYVSTCRGCRNGLCVPSETTMKVECMCNETFTLNVETGDCDAPRMSSNILPIVLPIVIIGVLVAIAVTVAVVLIKKRNLKIRKAKDNHVLIPQNVDDGLGQGSASFGGLGQASASFG